MFVLTSIRPSRLPLVVCGKSRVTRENRCLCKAAGFLAAAGFWRLVVAGVILQLLCQPLQVRAATVTWLGVLPGYDLSIATAVSPDGGTVVGYCVADVLMPHLTRNQAFRWSAAEGMVALGDYPGGREESRPFGVSENGSVIVGYGVSELFYPRATRWTVTEGMVPLYDDPLLTGTIVGVSRDGTKTLGARYDGKATIWNLNGTETIISDQPGAVGLLTPLSLSQDGSQVAGTADQAGFPTMAFKWSEVEGFQYISPVPGKRTTAGLISGDGRTLAGTIWTPGGINPPAYGEAFIWTSSTGPVSLGALPNGYAAELPTGVSDGQVVVGRAQSSNSYRPFIWDPEHGARDFNGAMLEDYGLDLGESTRTSVAGISPDGSHIVGYGHSPFGRTEAFLIAVPEPPTGLLSCAGLACLAAMRAVSGCRRGSVAR